MSRLHAEGANYTVRIEDTVSVVRVWKRPDLSFEAGAHLAGEISGHMASMVNGAVPGVNAIIMDLRDAPDLVGRKTRDAMSGVVSECEAKAFRFCVVVRTPTQALIVETVAQGGPTAHVRVERDYDVALAWARGG